LGHWERMTLGSARQERFTITTIPMERVVMWGDFTTYWKKRNFKGKKKIRSKRPSGSGLPGDGRRK